MSRPRRDTPSGRAYLDLQNQARREGRPTQQLLVLYAAERWLARLSASPHREHFVLKGGVLLAAVDLRRPTVDVDTLARGIDTDQDALGKLVAEIASRRSLIGETQEDDGIVFATDTMRATTIREGNTYEGVRFIFSAHLGTARVKVGLDISVGDPVTPDPQPVRLPSVRPGAEAVDVLGYPLDTVLAEKIATAIELGDASTRIKDYVDVWGLTERHAFSSEQVSRALFTTAAHRDVEVVPLSDVLTDFASVRARGYDAYRSSLGPDGQALPATFAEVVRAVSHFADRLARDTGHDSQWDPAQRRWAP